MDEAEFDKFADGYRVTCFDVSRKSPEVGAAHHGTAAEFEHFDGRRIPFADGYVAARKAG
jgi:hypothetical protein